MSSRARALLTPLRLCVRLCVVSEKEPGPSAYMRAAATMSAAGTPVISSVFSGVKVSQ